VTRFSSIDGRSSLRTWLLTAIIVLIVVVAVALMLSWPAAPATRTSPATVSTKVAKTMAAKLNPLRRVLTVSVVQDRARYVEVIVYSEEDFKRIIASWAEISEKFKKEFRSKVEGYGVKIEDLKVSKIPENCSIAITCIVAGCIWSTAGGYYADMSWLIRPLGLDFIDDHFQETTHSLEWTGKINNIETKIVVNLPPQSTPYEAWRHPVGHCHAHIWWPK